MGPAAGPAAKVTLAHLRRLALEASMIRQPSEMYEAMVSFRQFWATSIDWCSALSRRVERIIIMYEDLLMASRGTTPEASNHERQPQDIRGRKDG
jgi:hypothetical protein